MAIVGFAIQKGGVGKSTMALNFASFLALRGHRTLIIDFDAQANTTAVLLADTPKMTIKNLFLERKTPFDAIVESNVPGLDILPNDIGFAKAEWALMSAVDNTYQLRDLITKNNLDNQYEHIIIDAPPSLGIAMLNVLCASQFIIIPLSCQRFSVQGLKDFMDTLVQIRERSNPSVKVIGSFLNFYDKRKNLHQAIENDVANFFGDVLFRTRVRQSVKIDEANSLNLPIFLYAKNSPAAEELAELFEEAIDRLGSLFVPDILASYSARGTEGMKEVTS